MTQSHRPGNQEPDGPGTDTDFNAMLATAHKAADLARAAILPHFRQPIHVENKASNTGFDPVTAADQAAERAIRNEIEARWPDHGLIGEEYGETRTHAHYRWVIDPIDGTRSFIIGSPLWGTLIGVLDGDTPKEGDGSTGTTLRYRCAQCNDAPHKFQIKFLQGWFPLVGGHVLRGIRAKLGTMNAPSKQARSRHNWPVETNKCRFREKRGRPMKNGPSLGRKRHGEETRRQPDG